MTTENTEDQIKSSKEVKDSKTIKDQANKNKKTTNKASIKKETKQEIIQRKHDAFFKNIMGNKIQAVQFLEKFLTPDIKNKLDLNSLVVEPESFITDDLKKKYSDVIYSVKTRKGDDAFVYCMIEAQSSIDNLMPLRILEYMLLLLKRHTSKSKEDKLPMIIPLVVYNGKKPYTAPLSLWEMFDEPEIAKQLMGDKYRLIDLNAMSDDDINYQKHLSIALHAMKHIYERDTLNMLKELLKKGYNAIAIDKKYNYLLLKAILCYIDDIIVAEQQKDLKRIIQTNLPKESEEIMRTVADIYREEGMEIGIQRGMERGANEALKITAKNMLAKNAEPRFVSGVTGLSMAEVMEIKKDSSVDT